MRTACPSSSSITQSDSDAADRLSQRFPDVQLRRMAGNDGFAAGVNNGARATSSQFLLLLNPDCVLEPDACCQLADWLESHPDVAVAGPRIRNADGTVQPSARRFPDLTTAIAGRSSWLTRVLPGNPLSRHNLPARDPADATPVEVDWVSGACMCVRREAFDAIGGLDEGFFLYWEDADFCRRLKHAGLADDVRADGGRHARRRAQQPPCRRRVARGVPPQRVSAVPQARRTARRSCSPRSSSSACGCGWRS